MISIKKNIHFSSHNFSKNIHDKRIKINTNFSSRLRTGTKSLNEIQNKNNEIKQIIDLTITHFTIKCAFLCNQIEEMKKEYIEQLKLINDKFINDKKFVLIPNKKITPKLKNEIMELIIYIIHLIILIIYLIEILKLKIILILKLEIEI